MLLMLQTNPGEQSSFLGGYFRSERGCILIQPYAEDVLSDMTMYDGRSFNIDGGCYRSPFTFEHESLTVPADSSTELR